MEKYTTLIAILEHKNIIAGSAFVISLFAVASNAIAWECLEHCSGSPRNQENKSYIKGMAALSLAGLVLSGLILGTNSIRK